MAEKIRVEPRVLRWARERASMEPEELAKRVGLAVRRVLAWEESGELPLTHLERVANKTHTPIGFLFLPEPPDLSLPVADFRSAALGEPSPDLLETLYLCEQRQAWYRDNVTTESDALDFVGSVGPRDPIADVAENIRTAIRLDLDERSRLASWSEALRDLSEKVQAVGILMMRNGIVGTNTHRPLSVQEFRGFALSDRFAPLIFVNAADSKSAQMFTIAHELVHVWRGESGVSDAAPHAAIPAERYCNQVAAEVLIPMTRFQQLWRRTASQRDEVGRLAKVFKVSTLVVLIRAREAGVIADEAFDDLYNSEVAAARDVGGDGGGDFYRTQRSRLGDRFASAVIASAVEGSTSYTEAFELLGVRKMETFNEFGRQLGVIL